MEHFGYVIAITSMIVILFIVVNVYWDSKSNKVYKRFERLLEVAEISHRAYTEGRLREIERTLDHMKREMESAKTKGGLSKSLEEVTRASPDSSRMKEDRETMVVFRRRPKEDPSPVTE
jgi:Flp pilus assembly protein TadB